MMTMIMMKDMTDSIMDWFNNLSPGEKQYYYDEVEMEGKPAKAAKPPMAKSGKPKTGKPPKAGAAKAGKKPGKKTQLSPELRAKIEEYKKKNPEGLKKPGKKPQLSPEL